MDYNWLNQPIASTSASAYREPSNHVPPALPQEPGAYEGELGRFVDFQARRDGLVTGQGPAFGLKQTSLQVDSSQTITFIKLTTCSGADFHYTSGFPFSADLFDTTPTQATSPILGANPFANPNPTLFDPYAFDNKSDMSQLQGHPPPLSPFPLLESLPSAGQSSSLFEEHESSALNSFLTKFGEDQGFLFNPELPPGMPSPPSNLMAYENTRKGEEERRERDRLGAEVEGLNLDTSGGWAGIAPSSSRRTSRTPVEAPSALLGFAQPATSQDIKSDFRPATFAEGQPPSLRGESKTRGRSLADDIEQHGANGRDSKIHKATHDETTGDVKMEDADGSGDELDAASATGRRRTRRTSGPGSAASSRRRHSSTSRPAAVPVLPALTPAPAAQTHPRSNSTGSTGSASQPQKGERRAPLTEAEKRTNHILSEQRRRNQIKVGFASLVDLIAAGEETSGISVRDTSKAEEPAAGGGGKKKGANAGAGRGRGRKGDVGGGASKSVVLQKAARYVTWLEKGNEEIEAEVRRVEGLLAGI